MIQENRDERSNFKARTIHCIQNGYPQRLFAHIFLRPVSKGEIEEQCEKHWGANKFKWMRFFSIDGVEIMEEELTYVRNGDRIYVSKGQEFDGERNFGEYQLLKQLGQGGFGKVWLARSSITQQLAAIKILKLEKITGARDIDMIFREVETLKALSHPNIVKILNCYALANMQLVVVMEYLAGGELLALLKEKGRFDQPTAKKIFIQIVEAVGHCHSEGIIHRDLKLENVLLSKKQELMIKVADFGISGAADTLNPDVDVGTLRYMAPQVLNRKEKSNTAAVDVWACGIILYTMVVGRLPFSESNSYATTQAIISGKYSFPQKPLISMECQELISLMLTLDPKSRPSMAEILGHQWMIGTSQLIIQDRIIETESDIAKPSPQKQGRKLTELKKLPLIPKRFEKQKQQVIEELKCLRGSRARLQLSGSKRRVGQSPHYMQSIKCKEEESLGVRRKRSFKTGAWK